MKRNVKKLESEGTALSKKLLNIKELSGSIGLTVSFLRKAMSHYGLPYYKLGRCVRFNINDIEEWVRQRRCE